MSDGLNAKAYRLAMDGHSHAEVARSLGLTRASATGRITRQSQAIERDNRDLDICVAIGAGWSNNRICKEYGVDAAHVIDFRRELEALT